LVSFGALARELLETEGPLSDSAVLRLVEVINLDKIVEFMVVKDSHPGTPLGQLGNKNGLVLEAYRGFVYRCVVERLLLYLSVSSGELEEMSAFALVQSGFQDPIRAFIKAEPHSDRKIREGRLRIIAGVSLVDQLVERVLFRATHSVEIANWRDIPFCPGMSLQDSDQEFLYDWQVNACASHGDISGWDWCLPRWLMEDVTIARCKSVLNADLDYYRLVRAQFVTWVRGVFSVGSELWEQLEDGVQKSGSYRTSRDNSACNYTLQQDVAYTLGVRREVAVKAMGDDLLVEPIEGAKEELERLGFRVKVLQNDGPGNFEFCSTLWSGNTYGVPVNVGKMLYRLFSKVPGTPVWDETLHSLRMELRHFPEKDVLFGRIAEYVAQVSVGL